MSDTITLPRELAYRTSGGVEVALHWDAADGALTVSVVDSATQDAFALPVGDDEPLDVFNHPYWYAARRSLQAA